MTGAAAIKISHNYGKFVCVSVVSRKEYLSQKQLTVRCIFAHVPVVTQENLMGILADSVLIINKLALSSSC